MKAIQIPERIKPVCPVILLLLSACDTVPHRPGVNELATAAHEPAEYIDPTKSLFPLETTRSPLINGSRLARTGLFLLWMSLSSRATFLT